MVPPGCRPRVTADREQEIYDTALELVAQHGYDRLTLDAVAQHANASKATLYRRWGSKAGLVVEAVCRAEPVLDDIDTGSLRGDLRALVKAKVGYFDQGRIAVLSALVPHCTGTPSSPRRSGRSSSPSARARPGRCSTGPGARRDHRRGRPRPARLGDPGDARLPPVDRWPRPAIEPLAMSIIDQLVLPAATAAGPDNQTWSPDPTRQT